MLEQIQRDLFALGARLADPVAQDRGRVTKAAVTAGRHRAARGLDRRARIAICRRCAGSSSPAARRAGAALHVARTICRRAERAHGRVSADATRSSRSCSIYMNRLSDLLFVMARAANHRAGDAGNRVVSAPTARRGRCAMPTASGWRGRTTRISRWPRVCCPRACARTSPPIYAFARRADDFADEPATAPRRAASPARRLAARASDAAAAGTVSAGSRADDLIFVAARAIPSRCRLPLSLSRRSAERVPPGRDDNALRDAGTTCWTTAGARQTRSAGWCCASPAIDDDAPRRCVGRRLHGAAADELLAGSRASTGGTDGSTCPADRASAQRGRLEAPRSSERPRRGRA